MKNFKVHLSFIAILALLFASCSKEENNLEVDSSNNKATLSFTANLDDLRTDRIASKQSIDELPDCSENDPSYVMLILSLDGENVVGTTGTPFRVDLAANETFTVEAPELELEAGVYTLDYFAVHDDDDNLIWVAPGGGLLAEYLDSPLPLEIELLEGVKKYVDVSVVCFDNRFVNEYGYLFFNLDTTNAIEFCIFGNYCDPSGRHAPAAFSVDVWNYSEGERGELLYSNLENSVELDDEGDYAGTTVCMFLPDTNGLDEYYMEITLLNSGAYGDVEEEVIRSGVFTDEDIRELFDGTDNVDYYHFREGNCSQTDSPVLLDADAGGGGTPQCTTIDFEDLESQEAFHSDYYADSGVIILAGTDYPGNAMKIMAGTCSENVLHSLNYPFASVLFNFTTPVNSVSVESGDYGDDEDTITVTAYSGENGTGDVIDSQTLILEENASGCLPFNLEGEGIQSVVVFGDSSIEGDENTIFTDNLTFCR